MQLVSQGHASSFCVNVLRVPRLLTFSQVKRGDVCHADIHTTTISTARLLVRHTSLRVSVNPRRFRALRPELQGKGPLLRVTSALIGNTNFSHQLTSVRNDKVFTVHLVRSVIGKGISPVTGSFFLKGRPHRYTESYCQYVRQCGGHKCRNLLS